MKINDCKEEDISCKAKLKEYVKLKLDVEENIKGCTVSIKFEFKMFIKIIFTIYIMKFVVLIIN